MNQTDVHAAEKTDRASLRSFGSEDADEIRPFVFLKDERCDVWQFTDAVDDRELDVRIVFGDLLHDRSLCETDADDQVEISFGKRTHRRFDRVRSARLDVS